MTTRRGSGIRPTAYSWWFGKRIVRKRYPGVYAHIACSDLPAKRSLGFIGFENFGWWPSLLCRLREESLPPVVVNTEFHYRSSVSRPVVSKSGTR